MREGDVRKYHGTIGVILSIFALVQVGSGTLIAFNEFLGQGRHVHAEPPQHAHDDPVDVHDDESEKDNFTQVLHHYGERPVQALRVILGLGVIFMVISGTGIYVMAQRRKKIMSNQAL